MNFFEGIDRKMVGAAGFEPTITGSKPDPKIIEEVPIERGFYNLRWRNAMLI